MPINKDSPEFKKIYEDFQIHRLMGMDTTIIDIHGKCSYSYLRWFMYKNYGYNPTDLHYDAYFILIKEINGAINR